MVIDALRMWTARRWRVALLGGIATAVLVALPTAVIPNPIFGRAVEVTWWSYPVVVLTGILGGLLLATYVKEPWMETEEPAEQAQEAKASKLGIAGAFIAYFAVGCPVCNKLVLLALGASGAMAWFAPLQPILAVASVILMAVALRIRLKNQISCSVSA